MQEPWQDTKIVRRFRKMLNRPCVEWQLSDLDDFKNSDKLLFDSTGLARLLCLYGWLNGKFDSSQRHKLGVGLGQWLGAMKALAEDVTKSAHLAVLSDGGLEFVFKVYYLTDPDIGNDVVHMPGHPNPVTGCHVLGYDHVVTHYIGPKGLTPLAECQTCIPSPRFRLYTNSGTKRLAFLWPSDNQQSWELF